MPLRYMLALAVCCACYHDPEQLSYENALDREIATFTFQRPIEEVWPEVIAVLAENGFAVHETRPVEDRTVVSDLNPDTTGSKNGYRALVRVIRLDRRNYKIQINKQYESGEHKTLESWNVGGRPVQTLNWMVIERAEPTRASKILAKLHR